MAKFTTGHSTGSLEEIRTRLNKCHKFLSWREIASMEDYEGISHATLSAIARGRDPKSPAIRCKLGLPALAPAPVCPVHGVVHVSRRCPVARKPPQPWLSEEEVRERLEYVENIILWGR